MTVGTKLAKLDYSHAFIAEMSTVIVLLLGNMFGLPLSTSHIKTISCAFVGKEVNMNIIKQILITWITILPVCFMCAFLLAKWINF